MERGRKTARAVFQAGMEPGASLLVDVYWSSDGVPAFARRPDREFSQGVRLVPGLRFCSAGDGTCAGDPSHPSRPLSLARTSGIRLGRGQAGRAQNKSGRARRRDAAPEPSRGGRRISDGQPRAVESRALAPRLGDYPDRLADAGPGLSARSAAQHEVPGFGDRHRHEQPAARIARGA